MRPALGRWSAAPEAQSGAQGSSPLMGEVPSSPVRFSAEHLRPGMSPCPKPRVRASFPSAPLHPRTYTDAWHRALGSRM